MRATNTVKVAITLVAIGVSAVSVGVIVASSPRRDQDADTLVIGLGVGFLFGIITSVTAVWACRRSAHPGLPRRASHGAWVLSTATFGLLLGINWLRPPTTSLGLAVALGAWIAAGCGAVAAAWLAAVVEPELWAARPDLLPEARSGLLRAWPVPSTGDRTSS
ncbi:MAG TPA: hypothetical protein VFP41_10415 [Actinomycetota bacterium]|nr:hypothetical protein [Actinomycetota bacterium]